MAQYKIQNRFSELLAKKARAEDRKLNLSAVEREFKKLGFSTRYSSIYAWANNTITRFDEQQIAEFCEYLNCTPGELLVLVEVDVSDDEEEQKTALIA